MNEFQAHELASKIWSHSSTLQATAWRGELPGNAPDPLKRYVIVGLDSDTDLVLESATDGWVFTLSRIGERQQVDGEQVTVAAGNMEDLEDVSLAALDVARRFFEGEFGPTIEAGARDRALALSRVLERMRGGQP